MNVSTTDTLVAAIRSRTLAIPSWVLVIECFIGAGWLRAWAQKAISIDWWRGDALVTFLADTEAARVPWFHVVVDLVVAPNLIAVAAAVALVQLVVGLALVLGRHRVPALLTGIAMNVAFVLAGAVTPSAFYLLAQLAVLLWVIEDRRSPRARGLASVVSLGGLALAGSAVLSIGTLHPDHVIEDPSMMLVFLGLLAAVGAELARPLADPSTPEASVGVGPPR
ncbi:MAG: hypothetical protein AAGA90_06375 [Actinomycetota bacterium]